MRDYMLSFTDEAAAKSALPDFVVQMATNWSWDRSCVMAATHAGSTFAGYLGPDIMAGYWVCVSCDPDPAIAALPQCVVVGDRDTATILATTLTPQQLAIFSIDPILSGMEYFGG